MELKYHSFEGKTVGQQSSNRTFMELKLEFARADGDNIKF